MARYILSLCLYVCLIHFLAAAPQLESNRIGATILENQPAGTQIEPASAANFGTAVAPVVWTLLDFQTGAASSDFTIDPSTGVVTSLRSFDRETLDQYELTLTIEDSSGPGGGRLSQMWTAPNPLALWHWEIAPLFIIIVFPTFRPFSNDS